MVFTLLGVTYNTNNFGVRALLSGAVENLARANPDATIRVLDYQHHPATWRETTSIGPRELELINLRFSWKLHLRNNAFRLLLCALLVRLLPSRRWQRRVLARNPWVRRILESDACLSLAGGDSFSDIYRFRQFAYVAVPQLLVLLLRKPLVLLPQTYGPFNGFRARRLAGFILKRARTIYSRDQAGVTTVGNLLGARTRAVRVVPDLGFSMEPEPAPPQCQQRLDVIRQAGNIIVGLNISQLLYMGGYTGRNMFGLKEDYPTLVKGILDFLIHDLKATVLLTPHVYGGPESGESEWMLNRRLAAEMQGAYGDALHFLDAPLSHKQMKWIIGRCDAFVGARMHACVAAVSQCVPTVALAYSAKFAGVMHELGGGVTVVDLRHSGAAETYSVIRKAIETRTESHRHLQQAVPQARERIYTIFQDGALLAD